MGTEQLMGSEQLKGWRRRQGVGDGPSLRMLKLPRMAGDGMERKTVSQVLKSSVNKAGCQGGL